MNGMDEIGRERIFFKAGGRRLAGEILFPGGGDAGSHSARDCGLSQIFQDYNESGDNSPCLVFLHEGLGSIGQ